jgi:hypothetical protein
MRRALLIFVFSVVLLDVSAFAQQPRTVVDRHPISVCVLAKYSSDVVFADVVSVGELQDIGAPDGQLFTPITLATTRTFRGDASGQLVAWVANGVVDGRSAYGVLSRGFYFLRLRQGKWILLADGHLSAATNGAYVNENPGIQPVSETEILAILKEAECALR